jgi:hypothetical protein
MFNASMDTGNELASLVQELQQFDKSVARVMSRKVLPPIERRLDRVLRQYIPPRPDYPIRWTSERQRRFVLAKLRRENNLPYKRRGIQRLWVITITERDGIYTVSARNPANSAIYVYGHRQQRFLRKYPLAEEEVLNAAVAIEEGLTRAVDEVIETL